MDIKIRIATPTDCAAMLEIYRPYVEGSTVSFELELPSVPEMTARLEDTLHFYPWLVAEQDGRVIGYAYASKHRSRKAYQWAVETAVYVAGSSKRSGVAKMLYHSLFALLQKQSFFIAYAVIALPNEQSVKFHEASGFSYLCTFPRAGFKNGNWVDVGWWRREIQEPAAVPQDPKPFQPDFLRNL